MALAGQVRQQREQEPDARDDARVQQPLLARSGEVESDRDAVERRLGAVAARGVSVRASAWNCSVALRGRPVSRELE